MPYALCNLQVLGAALPQVFDQCTEVQPEPIDQAPSLGKRRGHSCPRRCRRNHPFLNQREFPVLIRAALAHVQFETIHPFLDGNGRVGRLLIALSLHDARALRQPLLYLSLYFKQHRTEYYRQLNEVRRTGDWESWLAFFLEGVEETATAAVDTCRRLDELLAADRARLEAAGRRAKSMLRVHHALSSRVIISLADVHTNTGMSLPTAASAMQTLVELGIAREITGRRRNRLFAYDAYLDILSEGTEPLPPG